MSLLEELLGIKNEKLMDYEVLKIISSYVIKNEISCIIDNESWTIHSHEDDNLTIEVIVIRNHETNEINEIGLLITDYKLILVSFVVFGRTKDVTICKLYSCENIDVRSVINIFNESDNKFDVIDECKRLKLETHVIHDDPYEMQYEVTFSMFLPKMSKSAK
jgi:hypothetical protein